MEDIESRFIRGLENYDLTKQDIEEGGWFYCGGRSGRHLNYWNMLNQQRKKPWSFPDLINECVCGHSIIQNCYITNKKQILTLGSCCIKRFIKNNKRTCIECHSILTRKTKAICYHCDYNKLLEKKKHTSLSSKEYKELQYLKLKLGFVYDRNICYL